MESGQQNAQAVPAPVGFAQGCNSFQPCRGLSGTRVELVVQGDCIRMWFGLETNRTPGTVFVPGCRRSLGGDAPRMVMWWAAWPVRMRLSSSPKATSMTRWWACFMLVPRLQQLCDLGRQTGNEETGVGRDAVAAAAFGLDPDEAGPVASRAVGIDRGAQVGAVRCPVAAGLNPSVALSHCVRVVGGTTGAVLSPFLGEGVRQTVGEALAAGPRATRSRCPASGSCAQSDHRAWMVPGRRSPGGLPGTTCTTVPG